MPERILRLRELTRESFAPYGDVITAHGAHSYPINKGTTTRYHDLARIETEGPGARTLVSMFRGQPFELPVTISMLERHPLGSQAFMPLHARPWIVVVASDEGGRAGVPEAFLVAPDAAGFRGVNYARNIWHHPLIALEQPSDFLVVDRGGDGNNLEECRFAEPYIIRTLDLF